MNHIEERCAVDDVDYHAAVGEALKVLIDGLTPFVERVLSGALPPGVAWTELLRRKDAASGRAAVSTEVATSPSCCAS